MDRNLLESQIINTEQLRTIIAMIKAIYTNEKTFQLYFFILHNIMQFVCLDNMSYFLIYFLIKVLKMAIVPLKLSFSALDNTKTIFCLDSMRYFLIDFLVKE